MLKTMKVLLLAGVLGGMAASPTLAQKAGGGGGGSMGGHAMGGHSMGGGGAAIYPRMGGGGGHSYSGSNRSFGGPGGVYMRRGGDFSGQGMRMENRRMRALAQPGGGDFPRERFRRGDRPDRFVRDNDFRRFDRNRFDRRHGRFDDDGRHHKRFRNRTGAFIFFNNGWWYDEPWWSYDTAYVGGYGDAHVQWCINHYRSYNPDNNTFVSYGGDVLECVSPYGP